jgi:hypothetical protein
VVVALVPLGVVTVTSTVPLPAGLVAVICVAVLPVSAVAAAVPNLTAVAALKLVPVMTTDVPPAAGPPVGASMVTVGGVAVYVNLSTVLVELVPLGVVTAT